MTDESGNKIGIARLALVCVLLLAVLVVFGLVEIVRNHERLLQISTEQHSIDVSFQERLDRLEARVFR